MSAKGSANASGKGEDDDRKWELGPTGAAETSASGRTGLAMTAQDIHYIGVVHDLYVGEAADKSPACSCLMLAYDRPNSLKFRWRNGVRRTDPDTMAVAISSEGIPCNLMVGGKERTLAPASIAAIEGKGPDIVIVVEEASRGRPVARGALVKKPDPSGGSIIVRGLGDVPFGTPIGGGKGPCKVPIVQ